MRLGDKPEWPRRSPFAKFYLDTFDGRWDAKLGVGDWVYHMRYEAHGIIESIDERHITDDGHKLTFYYVRFPTTGFLSPSLRTQLIGRKVSLLEVLAEASV